MENENKENQLEIDTSVGIGTKEPTKLGPAKVEIQDAKVFEVGDNKNQIVKCLVQHPDKDEPVSLSEVQYLKDKVVKTTALWYNLDDDNAIQKGSALATFMGFVGAKNLDELKGKTPDVVLNDAGYLCFKAY